MPRNATSTQRRAVMADVARLAGVSHQTVSRVLNDHPSVSPGTRSRILAAIEQLDYRPNSAARALVTRRTRVIGVISPASTLYGPASTLYGIEQAARQAGYFVSVASVKDVDGAAVRQAVERLSSQFVEGIVAIAPRRAAVEALRDVPAELPLVVVEGGDGGGRPVVCVDQAEGARLVTRHLLEQGAGSVWHIAGPSDWLEAQGRLSGWKAELKRAGVKPPEPLRGDWSPASGYSSGRLLAERSDVRAVFAANDQMALGALRAFHERGVRVPADVLVAGFDDAPESAYFTPPLTTVAQDFDAVGRGSMELLLQRIDGSDEVDSSAVIAPELVTRHSTVGRLRDGSGPVG
ncbi:MULTISPECIES: LacI family DNA-binding transcriptional regulator [unclassified Actinopolyspora]|uniref:LacI family DNA-binding transcriptional regulator n=1 Tax=unclassified Actinopolyspora TaxID=2639451 RepID=UPI0013F605BA|nr:MULTISPECIES: LacI family DNA-binding transcriptional regulator [unclassified Actinopolyspora]NHD15633.1 LacI family DNA-binding transcriptional regulator [Actinopolyspora sp. BKK2]NHE75154.1 LacI family DNA-binding transcriptional regulator [Actinopolyspora sp. BKK1]